MAAEIDRIFTAIAKSTWQFLIENEQGCYIPAYQRPYSWDKDNISRLFEDVIQGVRQTLSRPNSISFLGTLVAIHDIKYQTVQPIYRSEVPSRVMTIIDGQQRICTVIMCNLVLHDSIRTAVSRIEKTKDEHVSWIFEYCVRLLADLRKSFLLDQSFGDGNYRYYPRVIRAFSDTWSCRQGQARYESPMARLIWEYIDHSEMGKNTQFRFKLVDTTGSSGEPYKMVADAFNFIQSQIDRICRKDPDEYDFPDMITATQSEDFASSIWGYALPNYLKKYIAEGQGDKNYNDLCALMRLIIIAKYLNEHVAITVVVTNSEDDAFDMFEALNTTGEPLTAFETFKPKVIELEKLSKYEHSPSRGWMKEVERYLDRFQKADDKQRAPSVLSRACLHSSLTSMRWPHQSSLFVFLTLTVLLHCSQACFIVGHAHAVVTIPASPHRCSEHAPCHSPQSVPNESPARCLDYLDHVFLMSVPLGMEIGTTAPG